MPTQWTSKMKFTPLGSDLKSSQMHFKTTSFGKGQTSYEAVHLQWASYLTTTSLNILDSQFVVNLHGYSQA